MKTTELKRSVGAPLTAGAVPDVKALERLVAGYWSRAKAYAGALQEPPFHPETVHRLRTHLRRLQAHGEFLQRPMAASRLAQCVSWLSHLRMLDVFQRYLRRRGADVEDLRRVVEAVREEEALVAQAGRLEAIRAVLATMPVARMRRPVIFLETRLSTLHRETSDRLSEAFRGLSPEATRKELHRLRLLVKSLRYQEEIALATRWGNPQQVAALKRLQRTLGDYCDRDQFRRLAKKMGLACRGEIKKEYRRYRDRVRAAVRKLGFPESPAKGLR